MVMHVGGVYELPALPYKYKDLEPYISEEQLRIHYKKHHKGYVDGANSIRKSTKRKH